MARTGFRAMQTTLAQFNETKSQEAFALQNSKLLKVRLDDVRRPQILDTTVELIRERGLWEVRLADVAERAGISATSVVYYFGTKDELFAEAIHAADAAFYEPLGGVFERCPSAATMSLKSCGEVALRIASSNVIRPARRCLSRCWSNVCMP